MKRFSHAKDTEPRSHGQLSYVPAGLASRDIRQRRLAEIDRSDMASAPHSMFSKYWRTLITATVLVAMGHLILESQIPSKSQPLPKPSTQNSVQRVHRRSLVGASSERFFPDYLWTKTTTKKRPLSSRVQPNRAHRQSFESGIKHLSEKSRP